MTANEMPPAGPSITRADGYPESGAATWDSVYTYEGRPEGEAELQGIGERVGDLRLLLRWVAMSVTLTPSGESLVRGVEASLDAPRVVRFTLATRPAVYSTSVRVDDLGRVIVDTDASQTVTLSTADSELEIRTTESGVEWKVYAAQLVAPMAQWGAGESEEWVLAHLLSASLTPGPLGAIKAAAIMNRFASTSAIRNQTDGALASSDASETRAQRWAADLSPAQRAVAIESCRAETSIVSGAIDQLLNVEDLDKAEAAGVLLTASRSRALLESFIALLECVGAWPGHDEELPAAIERLDAMGKLAVRRLAPAGPFDDLLLSRAATFDPMSWWVQLSNPVEFGASE